MRLTQLCAVALASIEAAYGFIDTSPFFMFSTSELLNSAAKLSSAQTITSELSSTLSKCPSDYYVLVSQPGVTARDYASKRSTPALAQRMSSKFPSSIRSSVSIPDVVGQIDTIRLQEDLKTHCGVDVVEIDASKGTVPAYYKAMPKAISITFAAPMAGSKAQDLEENDALFASILDMIPTSNYTVLYTTTTPSHQGMNTQDSAEYFMHSEVEESLHMEIKRDLASGLGRREKDPDLVDGALFERYQFFTPGIFMGFLVGFFLLLVLYVGISALASLQVTYAAFDKEQNQFASKKAQ